MAIEKTNRYAIDAWTPSMIGKQVAQPVFFKTAIQSALTLRLLFCLPSR